MRPPELDSEVPTGAGVSGGNVFRNQFSVYAHNFLFIFHLCLSVKHNSVLCVSSLSLVKKHMTHLLFCKASVCVSQLLLAVRVSGSSWCFVCL